MKNLYVYQEAKNGFVGWTKEGLEFLLSLTSKDKRLRYKIKKQIENHTKKEKI
ncbi:hypothetical protein [Aliarcobacter butzleri]|jgi:hypothetical protein|uniref:hypothetical protein n=1 Tax=Aliarcobacter butzleri TaxID=28197 RepID=UPI002B23F489|nr:hypothetical protein [Aliarcobacter butzleri]